MEWEKPINENGAAQSPVEQQRNPEQMDKSLEDRTEETELRKQFLEKLMSQLGADPEKTPLRVQALIQQLSFEEDTPTGIVQDLDEELLDSASRTKQILQWIESGIENWRRNVSNNPERTGLEDGLFGQLVNYICEYLQGKGKKRLYRSLLEISKLSHPESAPLKTRCRQLIMNDAIMGFTLGRGTHKEPLLPLNSDRIDPTELFLRGWKRAARRMLVGSFTKKHTRAQSGSS